MSKHQLSLPPMPVGKTEPSDAAFRKSEQADGPLGKSEQLAAELLDEAFGCAGLANKETAHLCGVSVSMVEKWRSSEARGCPSFVQLLLLPPSFHIALHKSMNKRFGFGRAAMADLLEAVGSLAMVVER